MRKSKKELRKFALTISIGIAAISAILLGRGQIAGIYLLSLSGLILLCALVAPFWLIPLEWTWMKFAHYLGNISTYVLLTLTYFLIITPLGLLLRILGKDLLALKRDKNRKSYWIPIEPQGPSTRPDKPY